MSDTKELKLTFTGVTVHGENLAVLTTVRGDVPDDAQVNHELVYTHEDGDWEVYDAKDKNVIDATVDENGEEIALLTPDGFVLRLLPGRTVREEIDPSDDGPSELVLMRRMRRWPDAEVVAGMARRVYARKAGKGATWQAIDQGCFVPRKQRRSAIGFNGIDGWSSEELCAVGYKGEIWLRSRGTWAAADSPTNATLMSVACASEPQSYVAAGLGGTVLFGAGDTLRLLPQEQPRGHLWSVVRFDGSYFLSGDEGVYRLDGPAFDTVVRVPLTGRGKPSTGYLSAGGGVMWSVGDHDIFMTTDGVKWKRVPNP